ncbi:S-protein-like [Heracleum sosnowskyi]|uniref:S-protein homolog n=1 Tax=Heracleum sosnowskyi TaxID=360622 RepID=A0AAD8IRC2_9APIA|nr:S-protein-like [Heracleum sosnowskyi]
MKQFFPAIVIAIYLTSTKCYAKITVEIISGIHSHAEPVRVRCQSKDDDLGYHTLDTREHMDWQFKPTLIGNTLFFCHFYWNGKDKSIVVYDNKKMYGRCINKVQGILKCCWKVKEDGFYFSNINRRGAYVKMYDW